MGVQLGAADTPTLARANRLNFAASKLASLSRIRIRIQDLHPATLQQPSSADDLLHSICGELMLGRRCGQELPKGAQDLWTSYEQVVMSVDSYDLVRSVIRTGRYDNRFV